MQFWWHDDSYHFFYMIGQEVPKDAGKESEKKRIDIGASDYAVFTLKEQYWDKQAPDIIKMLIKYALCDWIKQSEMHYDNRKMYFISFKNGLYSVYLPLKKRMHSDYVMKNKKEEKKIYGVDEWISYIDEHITENLTAKGLAKLFHYSEKHLKNIFQLYYETRITDYIKQRKLYFAAEELKEGKNPESIYVTGNTAIDALKTTVRADYTHPELEWAMGSRKAGDATVAENSTADGYYVAVFISRNDNHYKLAQVRHILIKAEADENGEYTDEAKAAAKARAEEIYAEWKAGDATEESFAALAEEYSEDTGSNTNGGLYDSVRKGQMVEEFDAFCFGGHKSGDTAIVYGESAGSYAGYHIMYYVGEGQLCSESIAESDMRSADLEEWLDSLIADYEPVKSFWFKLVG